MALRPSAASGAKSGSWAVQHGRAASPTGWILGPIDHVEAIDDDLDRVALVLVERRRLGEVVLDAVDPDGALPRQVVEPDVLELDPLRLDPEPLGEAALEADRDVA